MEVRCPTCNKKLAERFEEGLLVVLCRGCKRIVTLDKRVKARVE
jgi:phage FluMu protein Com